MKYIVLTFLICYLSGFHSAQQVGDKKECKPNEVNACAPCPCPEPTCQIPKPKCPTDVACLQACLPFCACKEGFLRDNSTGICVPKEKCK
ncbi:unnamed protein product [Diabrotica balteata]|uniref:TIL domain-containing protein n=1 Tax=Diabrotica balteata TaxID=107213 RepID=A0A9N9TC02_DIABA|nr:unnamed protein product [Diabrotica balteata]